MRYTMMDLTGHKYGQLTVLRLSDERTADGRYRWVCRCDCGNIVTVKGKSLRNGDAKSCGCRKSTLTRARRFNDLTGQRIGRLTVLSPMPFVRGERTMWLCRCDCGNEKVVSGNDLQQHSVISCGCAVDGNPRHFGSRDRLYHIFSGIHERCYNENNSAYKHYGGRGISVCEEWCGKDGYVHFRDWAYANGYSDSLSIDRIDVNGNYEPSNCRWADDKMQANNTTRNRWVTIGEETKTLSQWCEYYCISKSLVNDRIHRGWDVERALTEPKHKR